MMRSLTKAPEDIVEAVLFNRSLKLEQNLLRVCTKQLDKLFVFILGFDVGFPFRPENKVNFAKSTSKHGVLDTIFQQTILDLV